MYVGAMFPCFFVGVWTGSWEMEMRGRGTARLYEDRVKQKYVRHYRNISEMVLRCGFGLASAIRDLLILR